MTPDNEYTQASLLNGPQTVDSLRSAGYASTEKAVAELIDNAFEADAENVVCVIVQKQMRAHPNAKRKTKQVEAIYVVDDGTSMDEYTLNQSLSFGGGDRHDRVGMGRFGMGLPQASVSQCRRTDVWAWQVSSGQMMHTALDLNYIEDTNDLKVPWPEPATETGVLAGRQLPDVLRQAGIADEVFAGEIGRTHGTVVGWTDFDLLSWAKPETVAQKVAAYFGRVYRRFLAPDASPGILAATLDELPDVDDIEHGVPADHVEHITIEKPRRDRPQNLYIRIVEHTDDGYELLQSVEGLGPDGRVRPNDPLYLIPAEDSHLTYWEEWEYKDGEKTAVLHRNTPPFTEEFDDLVFFVHAPDFDGKYHPVRLRCSMAVPQARPGTRAGTDTHQGQHAKTNQGISIVRAGRELVLTDRLFDEPRDRWFGVEVEFPPALDAEFGVSNSKQAATLLSQALSLTHSEDGKPRSDLEEEGILEPGTKLWAVYPVARRIYKRRTELRSSIASQKLGAKTTHPANESNDTRHATQVDAEATDDELTAKELEAKQSGTAATPEEVESDVKDVIEKSPGAKNIYTEEQVAAIAENLASGATGYAFLVENDADAPHFFRVEEVRGTAKVRGASKIIHLNVGHPVWHGYLDALRIGDDDLAKAGEVELRGIVHRARSTMVDLLIAWARIELSGSESTAHRTLVGDIRSRWGKSARKYLAPEVTADAIDSLDSLLTDLE